MQGIAALPTGMAPEGASDNAPAIGSLTAGEAATLGRLLTKVSEDEIEQLRELSGDLREFSVPELRDFLGGVDYIMQSAGNYKQSVRNLIARGIVEPGDLPAEYVPTFYSILRQMLVTALQEQESGAVSQNTEGMGFAKGGLVSAARKVAAAGRHGDTMLAHITPREAAALKAMGGAGTINPQTGLVEYKSFWSKVGNFLKKAAPVILPVALSFIPGLGTAVGGAIGGALGVPAGTAASLSGALLGAVGSGVGGLIAGQKPGQALLSAALGGIGGYAMSQLAPEGISGLLSGGATGQEALQAGNTMTGVTSPNQVGPFAPSGLAPQTPSVSNTIAGVTSPTQVGPFFSAQQFPTQSPEVSGGLGNLFGGVGNFVKQHPYLTAGLVGAGALAFANSGADESQVEPVLIKGPTGTQLLQQQPQKYGFNIANFQGQSPGVQVVPTSSPAFTGAPYTGQLPGLYGVRFAKTGGHVNGPGTGTSDDVPAMLSDGEFVLTAKAVRGAGNGDRIQGAKKLYKLMNTLEKRA